jgi:tripartite-type tricarboxylate transporter receptor subunit TctC
MRWWCILVPAQRTDFVALAKKQPGEINVGSAGIGTSPHLSWNC